MASVLVTQQETKECLERATKTQATLWEDMDKMKEVHKWPAMAHQATVPGNKPEVTSAATSSVAQPTGAEPADQETQDQLARVWIKLKAMDSELMGIKRAHKEMAEGISRHKRLLMENYSLAGQLHRCEYR